MKHSSQQSLSKLAEITDVILSQNTDYKILKDTLDKLTALFLSTSKLNIDADVNATHLHLASGKAIGLKWAAMCIQDLIRTKQFMSGVNKAILDKQKIKTEGLIQILYAGSGPFATIVMPLITKFTPDEIQFTCLEVNPISVQSLKNVIEALDDNSAAAIITEIHVYDSFKLGLKASGLTIPSVFANLDHEKQLTGVKTQYVANNHPYLQTILIR